jgi:FdhD protein
LEARLGKRTVTTGCGQGTVFGNLLEQTALTALPDTPLAQSTLYDLLANLNTYNETYRSAGAVHGCALCHQVRVLDFVEDVGRHNAVDTLAGRQWLNQADSQCADIFYTTGRLTSEMVLKVAQMGISVLVSRSGVTQKGVELAERFGVMLIARAKGKSFQAINAAGRLTLDAIPPKPPSARSSKEAGV